MSLLSRIKTLFSPAPAPRVAPVEPAPDIELSDDGFVLGARTVRWESVVRIRTYKLDFDTIDCVCLSFELNDAPAVEVTEESNGFNEVTDELQARFPGIAADWYSTVMTPAFERNETILFEKAAG
jgi:hypothetical protein